MANCANFKKIARAGDGSGRIELSVYLDAGQARIFRVFTVFDDRYIAELTSWIRDNADTLVTVSEGPVHLSLGGHRVLVARYETDESYFEGDIEITLTKLPAGYQLIDVDPAVDKGDDIDTLDFEVEDDAEEC